MVNAFEYLFKYGPLILVLSLPFFFSLWIAYRTSSWRRRLSTMMALFAGFVLAIEIYTIMRRGNLATLLTMLETPFILIGIALLIIAEGVARRIRSRAMIKMASETAMADQQDETPA